MRSSVVSGFSLALFLLVGTFCAVSSLPAPEQIQDGPNPLLDESLFGGMPAEDEPSAGVRQARAPTFFGPSIRVYSGGYGHGYPVYRPYGYYGGGSRIIITKRLGGYGYGGYGGHYYY
ncbi:Hypothetical predicted protein [Cloeon dipterum]|uniref:Uncharacterized protein n=1 Tax=Cloeon dipterum TaxID=197152 RepID=A0A8S1D2N2_9INSE|nr:Hypothetical predicted protein [Cloeon dipterum]